MSKKFTIKVAGYEWLEGDHFWWLMRSAGTVGRVMKMSGGKYEASAGCDAKKLCPSLRAAKAYVIKQLAGEKEKKR